MNKSLLILSAAAAFLTASCSENKTAETTDAMNDGAMTTTTTTTATQTSYSPEAIERRADRMSMDMASKMKFDDATRDKVRTAYMNRGQRLAELETRYATDTMGRAAAMRDVYTSTDTEMKGIFTDPTQYSAYESSRADYMDSRYMDDSNMSSSSSSMDNSNMSSSSDMSTTSSTDNMQSGTNVEKMKVKAEDGSKMKVKSDGTVKMKDADGEKSKM
ncbi:hypothetical protein [Hymenobacter sp. 102]|uniref:hypothetical protein n=1 Tax=Hymenobacter sp. 102 TaxID=3403152 RepID=UPI003CFAEEF8